MSTSALIEIFTDGKHTANLYKHGDGYPDFTGDAIEAALLTDVHTDEDFVRALDRDMEARYGKDPDVEHRPNVEPEALDREPGCYCWAYRVHLSTDGPARFETVKGERGYVRPAKPREPLGIIRDETPDTEYHAVDVTVFRRRMTSLFGGMPYGGGIALRHTGSTRGEPMTLGEIADNMAALSDRLHQVGEHNQNEQARLRNLEHDLAAVGRIIALATHTNPED